MPGQLPIVHSENEEISQLQTKWAGILNPLLKQQGAVVPTLSQKSIAANYAVQADDFVLFGAAKTAFSTFLPAPDGGRQLIFQKTDSSFSAITVLNQNGALVGGLKSTTLNTQGETLFLCADGTNWLILNRFIPSTPTAYTPTFAGLGTVTVSAFKWARFGPNISIVGTVTSGIPTATTMQISLPSGLTIASGYGSTFAAGTATCNNTTANLSYVALCASGGSNISMGFKSAVGDNQMNAANGNAIVGTGNILSFNTLIPITGWNT